MGCNIQVHIEVKKAGQWHHYAAPAIARNYKLFALLSGERSEALKNFPGHKPLACSREIPEDASAVTLICREQDNDCGVHGEGVLNADGILALQDALYEVHPDIARTGIDELDLEHSIFRTYIGGNAIADHQGWDDVRIVFWYVG